MAQLEESCLRATKISMRREGYVDGKTSPPPPGLTRKKGEKTVQVPNPGFETDQHVLGFLFSSQSRKCSLK